jgi:acetyl esterase/lipase
MPAISTKRIALSVVCVAMLAGSSVPAQDAATEIEFKADVEYGTGGGQPLKLNLAHPKNNSSVRPALLFIHGGGWAAGNRKDLDIGIKDAARRGFVAVSVGYRLAPKDPFPAQIEDVKYCVRWMRAHADELKLDPKHIGAIGFSAGAHLSMMLGVMDKDDGLEGSGGWADQSSKVQAVVAYFGPADLTSDYPEASKGILKNFLGGTLEEKKDDYRRASPITYVNAGDAPMLLFQGTNDVLVPYEQAFIMAKALTNAKVPGRVELLLNYNHGWGGKDLEYTQRESYDFFEKWLK